jgi:chromosome segregation ATPase
VTPIRPLTAVLDELKAKQARLEDEIAAVEEQGKTLEQKGKELALERDEVEQAVFQLAAYIRAVQELNENHREGDGAPAQLRPAEM